MNIRNISIAIILLIFLPFFADGIGDTPYCTVTGGQDRCPFMEESGWEMPVSQPPTLSTLNQYKSDDIIAISEGAITIEDTVVFKAAVSDPDSDQVKLQIELKEFSQSFNEQDLLESDFISSGSEAVVSRQLLVDGQYHWRARAIDDKENKSEWQEFGTAGNVDFEVDIIKVAVILAQTADRVFNSTHNKSYFETQIIPNVRDYWCEVSFGNRDEQGTCRAGEINPIFEVFDNNGQNYTLSEHNWQYYSQDYKPLLFIDINNDGADDLRADDRTMVFTWDAFNLADGAINYNDYDSIMVIYPGNYCSGECLFNAYWLTTSTFILNSGEIPKNWITVTENSLVGGVGCMS